MRRIRWATTWLSRDLIFLSLAVALIPLGLGFNSLALLPSLRSGRFVETSLHRRHSLFKEKFYHSSSASEWLFLKKGVGPGDTEIIRPLEAASVLEVGTNDQRSELVDLDRDLLDKTFVIEIC